MKLLLEDLEKKETKSEKAIDTTVMLWSILFGLIIVQKLWKYIGKPAYNHYSAKNSRTNSEDDLSHS